MIPEVRLVEVSREDVERIIQWLQDEEVCSAWFGRYTYGDPIHLGYHPSEMLGATQEEWDEVFHNPSRRILSIYTVEGEHIGEAQLEIEEGLGNAQMSVLIGRKDLWHHGYGVAAVQSLLDLAFNVHGLYRVWADVPEYNTAAMAMFKKLGFGHEGTLRQSRPHAGARFNSSIMGILAQEYEQRKQKVSSEANAV